MRAASAKRQRIARVREALQNIIDSLEREQARRRQASVGDGAPSYLLIEVHRLAADVDILIAKDLK